MSTGDYSRAREQNDRHHALDAVVIAASSRTSAINVFTDFHRRGKLVQQSDGLFVALNTGEIINEKAAQQLSNKFPQPWENFRDELLAADSKPSEKIRAAKLDNYPEADLSKIRPICSFLAPKRRNHGAAHKYIFAP